MKQELENAAIRAKKTLELQQASAFAIILRHLNMPKVSFRFSYKNELFDCIATFDGDRLFDVEIIHPKMTGRISFNKR